MSTGADEGRYKGHKGADDNNDESNDEYEEVDGGKRWYSYCRQQNY